jgi:hypothetical protein
MEEENNNTSWWHELQRKKERRAGWSPEGVLRATLGESHSWIPQHTGIQKKISPKQSRRKMKKCFTVNCKSYNGLELDATASITSGGVKEATNISKGAGVVAMAVPLINEASKKSGSTGTSITSW